MIELNKNKLIPGVDTSWGDITGDISKQSDLMSTLSSYATESWVSGKNYLTASSLKTINNQSIVGSGNINIETSVPDYYATKAWVSEQGYLTSETLPSDLATESWVSSQGYITSEALSGFATESWVSSQGYLTSVPDTFATKAWVSEQGYLTSETLPSDIATESWVSSQGYITTSALSGYATESWVSEQGYLTSSSLKTINEQSLVGEGDLELVDLHSNQEIDGFKTFNGVQLTYVYFTDNANINSGDLSFNTNHLNFMVNDFATLNGATVATTDYCFVNRTYSPYGFRSHNTKIRYQVNYNSNFWWSTHTGRLFVSNGTNKIYEFNGDRFTQMYLSVNPMPNGFCGLNVLKTATSTFYNATDGTYIWDDANSDWLKVTEGNPSDGQPFSYWVCGNTIRFSDSHKLIENNGTYEWVEDVISGGIVTGKSYVVNGTVYIMAESGLYTYDESTKEFTLVGNYRDPGSIDNRWEFNGEFFYIMYLEDEERYSVRKLYLDLVGEDYIDDEVLIPYSRYNYFYGGYNGFLYYIDKNTMWYCYDVDEELPEVPETNGTYVLKAVRTSSGVTYEWVADEVPQAVQITNEILS